jgi:hypothetical protein
LPIPKGTMKFFACVLFAVMISSFPAMAAVEQCRFIKAKPDREACYDRQAKSLAAKWKRDVIDGAKTGPDEEMKIESDRLSKSLRSICRGC